jgi:hypothetical protein
MTQHLLIENWNFHEIRREGQEPQKFVEAWVKQKSGVEPVAVMVFERQNAAAVVMPSAEVATQFRCVGAIWSAAGGCLGQGRVDVHTV